MKYFVERFTEPGDLVMDPCGGTFSTMHACIALDQHRRFIGSDADPNCVLSVEDHMLRVFASQLLNPNSDLTPPSEDYKTAAQTVRNHDLLTKVNARYTAWSLPPGLIPMQSFPEHIVDAISQYYNDYTLLSSYIRKDNTITPAQQWNNKWYQRFNEMDPQALLTAECLSLGVRIKPSNIKHPKVGLGVFAKKAYSKGDIIGYYYGALVYGDIGEDHRSRRKYGSGMMAVSSADYLKWALRVNHQFRDSRNKMHIGYICPGPFCAMRFINDARYASGDLEKEQFDRGTLRHPRQVNVQYVPNKTFKQNNQFESFKAIAVKATMDILPGQEFYLNYGENYSFPDIPKDPSTETQPASKITAQGHVVHQPDETQNPGAKESEGEPNVIPPVNESGSPTKEIPQAEVTENIPDPAIDNPFFD